MGFWPFGAGKKSRLSASDEQVRHILSEKENNDPMARSQKGVDQSTRASSRRGRDDNPSRLSKSRTASYQSTAPTAPPRTQTAHLATRPAEEPEKGRNSPATSRAHPSNLYQQNPLSQSSIGPDNFSAAPHTPTLHAKRSDYSTNMTRRKSSKRKAEDYAREREVRAMSSPIPVPKRPATYSGSGPLRRDIRIIPGDLNRRLHRPTSEISLPLPESISDDGYSNRSSFKIGILSALSPRPMLRYDANPRSLSGKQPVRHTPVQQILEEEDLSSAKRIDDLADDLDAGGIREVMEKDRKRRERKKEAEKAKLQRKLQRRADRQTEEETRRTRAEEYVSRSQSRLEGEGTEAATGDSNMGYTDDVPNRSLEPGAVEGDPFADPPAPRTGPSQAIRNPFEDEKDLDVMREPSDREDEPPLPVKSPLRKVAPIENITRPKPSQATISPPTSPIQRPLDGQSFSQASGQARDTTPDIPRDAELERRSSDQSGKHPNSWTSFFRRGGRRKTSVTDHGRTTPSEFSNTSRESFARNLLTPIVPPRSFRRSESGTPQRTMSKFREDLPELPISPPDSRVQSPDVAPAHHATTTSYQPRRSMTGTLDARSLATSSSNPTLDKGRPDSRNNPRQSIDGDITGTGTASMAVSQSLASVDSEASWLSGRPVKRLSGPIDQALPEGEASPAPQIPGAFEPEEDGLADDEYLKRLHPAPVDRRQSAASSGRKASSTLIDLQRERDRSPAPDVPPLPNTKDESWHGGVGRQATVVRQASRAKSKEGLLKDSKEEASSHDGNDNDDDDDGESSDGEAAIAEVKESPIMRARSVEYKGHIRHISAGSARLLDIRRSSVQSTDTPPRSPVLSKAIALSEQGEPGTSTKLE